MKKPILILKAALLSAVYMTALTLAYANIGTIRRLPIHVITLGGFIAAAISLVYFLVASEWIAEARYGRDRKDNQDVTGVLIVFYALFVGVVLRAIFGD